MQETVERITAMQSKLLGENQSLKNEIQRLTKILETSEASSTSSAGGGAGGAGGGKGGGTTDGTLQKRYESLVRDKNQVHTIYHMNT